MADIEKIVEKILHFEAGTPLGDAAPDPSTDARNRRLFALARRTGWRCDPLDSGGATMCGVTLAAYRAYRRRHSLATPTAAILRTITYDEWLDVLREGYWNRWRADAIASQEVAEMLVDYVWASGVVGVKRPQRLLGVRADGIVGPATLAAVASREPAALLAGLTDDRLRWVEDIVRRRPAQRKWLRGWRRRILTFGSPVSAR